MKPEAMQLDCGNCGRIVVLDAARAECSLRKRARILWIFEQLAAATGLTLAIEPRKLARRVAGTSASAVRGAARLVGFNWTGP
jgi:hypothetical protein